MSFHHSFYNEFQKLAFDPLMGLLAVPAIAGSAHLANASTNIPGAIHAGLTNHEDPDAVNKFYEENSKDNFMKYPMYGLGGAIGASWMLPKVFPSMKTPEFQSKHPYTVAALAGLRPSYRPFTYGLLGSGLGMLAGAGIGAAIGGIRDDMTASDAALKGAGWGALLGALPGTIYGGYKSQEAIGKAMPGIFQGKSLLA